MKNTTAIVLAAGLGTRMKTDLAKVLHPVGSSTVLGKVISNLKKAGIEDIVAVVGYKAELVESSFKKDVRKFVLQEKLLGSGDAARRALEKTGGIKSDVLITCGDAPLISADTYRALVNARREKNAACSLLTSEAEDAASYGRIVRSKDGNVAKIVEEKDASPKEKKITEINVASYCFDKRILEKFIGKIEENEKKKEFYLTDIIGLMREAGKKVAAVSCVFEEALGINTRKDLAMANKIENAKKIESLMDSGVTVIAPAATYVDETAEIGKDTIIYPDTVIEGPVKIGKNCKIGPFARLRPGTELGDNVEVGNFVELVRTKVGDGTKVKHHTYLGDTVVGKDVNIGAGVITANYDGVNKNTTVIEDKAFIGIGARLIAPVKIGAGAKVGAGSVVTKNKNVSPGQTVAGVPARVFKK